MIYCPGFAYVMKITHKSASRILWYESAGFLMLILLSWLDEFHATWHESAVESAAVLAVWSIVFYFTRRLVSRLYYLERFLRVCAWCRKINLDDKWMPLEQYFAVGFHTETTHGVCPECAQKIRTDAGLGKKSAKPSNLK
jgi:hypothetical protein